MKSIAPFAIALLLASCASSSTGVIDQRTLGCESGQDLQIMVGIDNGQMREDGMDNRFDLLVEVSNNSHQELTVTAIRVEQTHAETTRYRVESAYRKFDQPIAEGKDFTFHLPMTGRGQYLDPSMRPSVENPVSVAVTTVLTNGDIYRCEFALGSVR